MFKIKILSKHEANLKKRKRILEATPPWLGPRTPVNAILKEKWIKVQEGGKPKGPSDPKDHRRDKAHDRIFYSGY